MAYIYIYIYKPYCLDNACINSWPFIISFEFHSARAVECANYISAQG